MEMASMFITLIRLQVYTACQKIITKHYKELNKSWVVVFARHEFWPSSVVTLQDGSLNQTTLN